METPHEKIWFHKTKILPSFPSQCYLHQLFSSSLNGSHIQGHWRLKPWPYYTKMGRRLLNTILNLQKLVI